MCKAEFSPRKIWLQCKTDLNHRRSRGPEVSFFGDLRHNRGLLSFGISAISSEFERPRGPEVSRTPGTPLWLITTVHMNPRWPPNFAVSASFESGFSRAVWDASVLTKRPKWRTISGAVAAKNYSRIRTLLTFNDDIFLFIIQFMRSGIMVPDSKLNVRCENNFVNEIQPASFSIIYTA